MRKIMTKKINSKIQLSKRDNCESNESFSMSVDPLFILLYNGNE